MRLSQEKLEQIYDAVWNESQDENYSKEIRNAYYRLGQAAHDLFNLKINNDKNKLKIPLPKKKSKRSKKR